MGYFDKLLPCLGLTFGCEKFHDYVYRLVVDLETDHKPLVSIVKKNLCDMSPRIQRMMMKIQRYDFKLSYTPGKHLVVADTLSRAAPPLNVDIVTTETDVAEHSDLFISMIDASEKQLDHILMETLRILSCRKSLDTWIHNGLGELALSILNSVMNCQLLMEFYLKDHGL